MSRYVIEGGRVGYDRLRVLATAWMPTTSSLFDRVGIKSGMHCLDLGCGSGAVAFEIARRVGPDGSVVGLDMDETQLALARESALNDGISNVQFRLANVDHWREENAYDLVYSRFLLQHLKRPLDVLRRVWAAVRGGGAIVIEDADHEGVFCHPPNDAFDFHIRAYRRVLALNGGDPSFGRKLYRMFMEAGIADPNLHMVQRVESNSDAKSLPYLTLGATRNAIVDAGIASTEEVESNLADLARFLDDPTTVIGLARVFQVWARRSTV